MLTVSSFPSNPVRRLTAEWVRKAAGFTLPELIITVAIVGILAALAAPSLSSLISDQRAKSTATDLYVALAKARSEAIGRNANVTLAPKTGGWQAGWTITDAASTTLEDHPAITNATIVGPTNVIYRASGRISGTSAPTFDIQVTGGTTHRCVTIDLSGRPNEKAASC